MTPGDPSGKDERAKKTQMAGLIPPPPTVGAASSEGGKGFPFPAPPRAGEKPGLGRGLPSFAPPPVARRPTGQAPSVVPPIVAPRVVAPVAAPLVPVPPEPTVDLPLGTEPARPTPDFQRFDPLQMVDDDDDWMTRGASPSAPRSGKTDVDEGATTNRYASVAGEAGPPGDDEPTLVRPPPREAEEPTTVYSKVLKKSSAASEEVITQRQEPVAPVVPAVHAERVVPVASSRPPAAAVVSRPVPSTSPAPQSQGSSLGVLIGVVVGFVIVAGIGWFVLSPGDDGDEVAERPATPAAPARPSPAPEPVAEERVPAPAPEVIPAPTPVVPAPPPEPLPEAPRERPAKIAEPASPEAAEPEPEPEPAPEPAPEPTPAPVDESEAGKLVDTAKSALETGDHRRAYDEAARAYAMQASNAALEVMALAACHLGEAPDARSAYRKLVGRSIRRHVTDTCVGLGIRIQWDGDGWSSTELLKRAEEALARGEFQSAHDLAQASHKKKRASVAVSLMAQAMCGLRQVGEAKRLHDLVSATEQLKIVEKCKELGVELGGGA